MMKSFPFIFVLVSLWSCSNHSPIVNPVIIDSFLTHYTPSNAAKTNEQDLAFWKARVETMPGSFVNEQKYAQALVNRFHLYGDISDLETAKDITVKLSLQFGEPGYLLSLAAYDMLQHRFAHAKKYIDSVKQMKAEHYSTEMMSFDVDFELGNYYDAGRVLQRNAARHDYAYNFRLSRQDHYSGSLDSAIGHMLRAAELDHNHSYLKQVALSNAADLYVHAGNLRNAAELYIQCLQFNSSDFHSWMGLARIVVAHDRNDSLGMKMFDFVRQKISSPDPLLRLSETIELKDSAVAKSYASQFVKKVSARAYGEMYNKYLIQLYTGILSDPEKALQIAQREIQNRATPQTYSWLAWSYFANQQHEKALAVYRIYVSGKPLEATELFWMGKLMKGVGKSYNATQFFKAAKKNEYDLTPAMRQELKKEI